MYYLLYQRKKNKDESWGSLLNNRSLKYYFFSWIIFNVANCISYFVRISYHFEFHSYLALGTALNFIGVSIFALVSGYFGDKFGRRRSIIIGIVMLIVSYGLFGLTTSVYTYLINRFIYGAAWGILMVNYF